MKLKSILKSPYDKQIASVAIPALGTLIADPLVTLVDTAYVGHVSSLSLAALGVNAALFALAFYSFNFLSMGTAPILSHAIGEKKYKSAGQIAMTSLALAIILGVVVGACLLIFSKPLLSLMGASQEVYPLAFSYMKIRAFAAPAVLLVLAGHGVFRGYLNTKTPFIISIGINLVNLVLDPLLIFYFELGVAGAAYATVFAQWAGAILLWWAIFKGAQRKEIYLDKPTLPSTLKLVQVGSQLWVRTFCLIGVITLGSAVAARVSDVALAAHQVALEFWVILALATDSLGIAGQTLISRYKGEGSSEKAKEAAQRLLFLGLCFGCVSGAGLYFFIGPLSGLFTNDPAVLAQIIMAFYIVVFMQPLNAVVFVWDGIYLGAHQFRFLKISMLVSTAGAAAFMLLVLPLGLGLKGIWQAMIVLMLLRLGIQALRYRGKPL